ncbi:MAG: sensor histidine kinase [Clostridia bacterium]|nr:sensor histidine kinase [Clostridia bacterium]
MGKDKNVLRNIIITAIFLAVLLCFLFVLSLLGISKEHLMIIFFFCAALFCLLTLTFTFKTKQQKNVETEIEKERMRSNLLRAVSHDLRTPLTTIYASSSTLLENSENLSEQQKRLILKGIKEDSDWLVRMVENLLSVTRIDSGMVKIIKVPTVLEELVDSVILSFNKRYPKIEVSIDIPDDIVVIPMDAMLIKQVIINILENAVQHAKGMDRLSLKVFILGKNAVFEIQDNGCGIDEKRLPQIFKGFYEFENEIADGKKRNTGIGLSVCATIIRAHDGNISAENLRNGGAVFRFVLNTEENRDE